MEASTLAQLDTTEDLPDGFYTFSVAGTARSNVKFLYNAVTQALAGVDLQRWLDTLQQTDWIGLARTSPIFLILVPILLSLLSQKERLGRDRRPKTAKVLREARRLLRRHNRSTQTEERGNFTRASSTQLHQLRGNRDHAGHGPTKRTEESHVLAEVEAARLIQRWVRGTFQPWLRERASRSCYAVRSPLQVDWTDQDLGAVVVTVVDHDFTSWTVGLEHPGDTSFLDVDVNGFEPIPPDSPVDDDVDDTSPQSSPRCRGAATISSTRLLPSRNQTDGLIVEETSPALQMIPAPLRDDQQ
ncbi:hypothetical protein HPB50_003936 [Hyalomma asiaticum]|uniref:Uncharacterized protein n=1 Tax=Hyalomma asiaticum TaxID=266040 RepID=A0ACB7RH43_HYAAI|nr:hypothetical protein HPB50_003936 [Hyalomma asiaticum]